MVDISHKGAGNRPIGSPVERIEDLRFLRGRGQLRRRRAERGRAARRDPAQLRRARPHPLDRCGRRAEAARRPCRHHARPTSATCRSSPCGRSCCRSSSRSSSRSSPRTRCATSASRSRWCVADSPALAEDALDADRARHRGAAGGRRAARRRAPATVSCSRHSGRNRVITLTALRGDARRRVPRRALHPARAVRGAALHRGADGAARPARRMGRREGPPHRARRRPRCAFHNRRILAKHDGPARRRHHHDRGRRRRRLRRARRVLSGGFPDPVRGAPARPRR